MRKVIAAINVTLDGFCEHTAINPDDEIHQHYSDLLANAGVILYGRITYLLMEYWPMVMKNPTGNRATDEFAVTMDNIPKVVFSRTLKTIDWETARLAQRDLKEEVLDLKQQPGKDILVGSRSLILSLLNLNLIDEFQLCIHPVVLGNGSVRLFEGISDRINLQLLKTKTFSSGAVIHYYKPEAK
ncbi:dihydrofolate reductase family protein [Chryseosolibacter indicus]|uniref:Dihydrofolate reductase family protein n=1 Tax=Chryseosolibacter indicus TaxID=2782351 RepID=A0ABS5VYS8_9BACT|nr:dihydrofolate reductase family protein [Chryseosolibacter indicus]MBT1706208.1 dihydrofolate reductase family protein [Chryseosolibacter indicus]